MDSLFSQLEWLPRCPGNFSDRIKTLERSGSSLGTEFQALATHALDVNQLTRLGKAIAKAHGEGKSLDPLVPFRLAVLSNSTFGLIAPPLIASAARHGIALQLIIASYAQVAQEALSPDSKVNTSKPDGVLLAVDHRALPLDSCVGDREAASARVERARQYLTSLSEGIKSRSNAVCIFQTVPPPVETVFGSLECVLPGTMRSLILALNSEIAEFVRNSGDVLLDIAGLAATVGLANWHDTRLWNLGKFPFSDQLIPLYAEHVARTVAAVRGRSRKALILDLDNTIWGGVIGDDGPEGINCAQGDPQGEAYLAVQRMALELRQRGVVLAVCSKNFDEVARIPFQHHPEMLLRLEHFAVFQANWNDKAGNIRAIADHLCLGLEALVFLDDNPMERGLVRTLLPQVAVPELPKDPDYYARTLSAAGYFEPVAFSAEDRGRAQFYQDNARRASLQEKSAGLDAYLASLEMTITFQPFDSKGRERIVQLMNKSNQYNLTVRRYTVPEIVEIEGDPEIFTLQARLADIYGDNGMISAVICRPGAPGEWDIDSWLMSCRVLGRKVEHMVLNEIVAHARSAGIRALNGVYKPSGRNQLVIDHYAKLGFSKIAADESGLTRWKLVVKEAAGETAPMKVVSQGFDPPRGIARAAL